MKSYFALAGIALMSAFTACSNEDEVPQVAVNNGNELIVNTVGVAEVGTKSGIRATEFTNGEQLGVYVYRNQLSGNYNDNTGLVKTTNVPYVQYMDNSVSKWKANTQAIILSNVTGKVYAYYPYSASNVDKDGTAIPITVKESQGTGQSAGDKDYQIATDEYQYDYMWATAEHDVSNVNPSVNLTMKHALSMASFVFKQTADNTSLYPGIGKVTKIVMTNASGSANSPVKTGAGTMNIATGALTVGTAGTITVSGIETETLLGETDESKIPHVLMYPAETVAANEVQVTVTVDGIAYTVTLPEVADGWQAGKNYQYVLTMKGTGLTVSTVTITDWGKVEVTDVDDVPVQTPDVPQPQP